MPAILSVIWCAIGLALAGGTTQLPPGIQPAPVIALDHVPASATHRPKGDATRRHPVQARLLVDSSHAVPGKPLRVGVHLSQDAGWHTYWKSPGQVGLPTDIRWTVPAGSSTTPYEYPVPSRFELEGLVSYGYDGQVLLFTELTLPEGQPDGPVEIGAEVDWLVCKTSCIKGTARLERTIEVKGSQPVLPSISRPLFDAFAAQHPEPLSAVGGIEVSTTFSPAVVPKEGKFTATITLSGSQLVLPQGEAGKKLWPRFVPIIAGGAWQLVKDIPPTITTAPGALQVVVQGETLGVTPSGKDAVGGLVTAEVGGQLRRFEFTQPLPMDGAAAAAAQPPEPPALQPPNASSASIGTMLFFAFLGGLILNIMPCVLPVLSLKIYSIVEQTDVDTSARRTAGLAYTAGVVLSFLALAGAIIMARSIFDMKLGWGQQFQSPVFIIALASLVFVFGLSLFGVFEVPALGATKLSGAQNKEGWVGHLLTGAFATILATPCSAPFLGTGIGFAMSLPPAGLLFFFAVAGLGLASPFLLIAYVPALVRFLPQPGAWMETFKQFLGFTLMATTVWLLDALNTQVGSEGVFGFLVFLTALAMSCWVIGRWAGPIASTRSKLVALAVALLIALGVGRSWLIFEAVAAEAQDTGPVAEQLDYSEKIPWHDFSEERVTALAGRPIFIDFTADWCLSCKANEKTILSRDAVRQAMADKQVVPLKADFTKPDPVIQEWLDRYEKAGVPMYLVIPADRSKPVQVLPEVLTVGLVVDALGRS
jgi:thiol:disulfide interchange protein DsbD